MIQDLYKQYHLVMTNIAMENQQIEMIRNGLSHESHDISWLVGSTPLKNMKVNGKDYPIYYEK